MIYHFYKADCYRASRVLMQSRWDGDSIFIHKSKNDDYKKNIRFGFLPLLRLIRSATKDDAFVFHAQSALPYLLFFYLCKKITGGKMQIVYDIHDLHEWESGYKVFAKSGLRYFVLGLFERFIFELAEIKKITVSIGLALIMAKKYNKRPPIVVRNTSSHVEKIESKKRKNNTVVFFGIKEHAPVGLMSKLNSMGVTVHLYGRGITADWLAEVFEGSLEGVKVFGEYNPEEMSFLYGYKVLILYPAENKLNYKYSMPNKLFQAIDHGVCVVVSNYFEEILQTFQGANGCVYSAADDNIQEVVAGALENWTENSCDAGRAIKNKIFNESKKNYLDCIMPADFVSN